MQKMHENVNVLKFPRAQGVFFFFFNLTKSPKLKDILLTNIHNNKKSSLAFLLQYGRVLLTSIML